MDLILSAGAGVAEGASVPVGAVVGVGGAVTDAALVGDGAAVPVAGALVGVRAAFVGWLVAWSTSDGLPAQLANRPAVVVIMTCKKARREIAPCLRHSPLRFFIFHPSFAKTQWLVFYRPPAIPTHLAGPRFGFTI